MPHEVTITTYSINELEPEARTKAIEQMMDQLRQDMNPNDLTNKFKEKLKTAGLGEDLDVEWSLTHCQGDGVAFYGVLDLDTLLTSEDCKPIHPELRLFKALELPLTCEIVKNEFGYQYSHYNTMRLNLEGTADAWHCPAYRELAEKANEDEYLHTEPTKATEKLDRFHTMTEKRLNEVEEWLRQYIKDVSKSLESFGYNFLECVIDEQSAVEHAVYDGIEFTKMGDIFSL